MPVAATRSTVPNARTSNVPALGAALSGTAIGVSFREDRILPSHPPPIQHRQGPDDRMDSEPRSEHEVGRSGVGSVLAVGERPDQEVPESVAVHVAGG